MIGTRAMSAAGAYSGLDQVGTADCVAELVEHNLLEIVPDGWRDAGFLLRNTSREAWAAKRARWKDEKWQQRHRQSSGDLSSDLSGADIIRTSSGHRRSPSPSPSESQTRTCTEQPDRKRSGRVPKPKKSPKPARSRPVWEDIEDYEEAVTKASWDASTLEGRLHLFEVGLRRELIEYEVALIEAMEPDYSDEHFAERVVAEKFIERARAGDPITSAAYGAFKQFVPDAEGQA